MQDQHFLHDLTWFHEKIRKNPNFVHDTYSGELKLGLPRAPRKIENLLS